MQFSSSSIAFRYSPIVISWLFNAFTPDYIVIFNRIQYNHDAVFLLYPRRWRTAVLGGRAVLRFWPCITNIRSPHILSSPWRVVNCGWLVGCNWYQFMKRDIKGGGYPAQCRKFCIRPSSFNFHNLHFVDMRHFRQCSDCIPLVSSKLFNLFPKHNQFIRNNHPGLLSPWHGSTCKKGGWLPHINFTILKIAVVWLQPYKAHFFLF